MPKQPDVKPACGGRSLRPRLARERRLKVQIEELMTKDVEVVAPETPLADLITLMLERRISCVIVCEERVPVGVISERDLVGVLSGELSGRRPPGTAAEVMSGSPVTVGSRWSVERAVQLIQQHRIRRLPVVDGEGLLVGIVTQTDLVAAQRQVLERTVLARTQELEAANERLRDLSLTDDLLGIGNRRAMNQVLERIHRIAERYQRVYSLALFDVDHFKGYNDSYGHPEGDQVLRGIARTLCRVVRTSDSVYRYGGEEILVLLPETPLAGAQVLAERAREAVQELHIRNAASPLGWVSVSGGIAASHRPGEGAPLSWHEPLARADAALYEAKQSGRNRVVLARDGASGRPPDA